MEPLIYHESGKNANFDRDLGTIGRNYSTVHLNNLHHKVKIYYISIEFLIISDNFLCDAMFAVSKCDGIRYYYKN